MASFMALAFTLDFMEPAGSQAQLAVRVRIGRTCTSAQDFPRFDADGTARERQQHEDLEDEVRRERERSEERWDEMARLGQALWHSLDAVQSSWLQPGHCHDEVDEVMRRMQPGPHFEITDSPKDETQRDTGFDEA